MSGPRQRKNMTASNTMDVHDLKKIVSKNDMDRQKKSSSFSQSDVSGKWASADESLSTRFNNKEAGFLAGIANSVGEQFNVSPSTILLPVWAFVFTSLFLATKYLFKNYQIHVMVPERTHTLSATKLVEVRACPPHLAARRKRSNFLQTPCEPGPDRGPFPILGFLAPALHTLLCCCLVSSHHWRLLRAA